MTKKVSLNIPDESFEGLKSLSALCKQDITQTIVGILETAGSQSSLLTYLSKEYKVPVDSKMMLHDVLNAAYHSIGLFNEVLEKLGAKGLFTLEDLCFDLDEDWFNFIFDGLSGNNLLVDNFDVKLKPGSKRVTTRSYINVEEVSAQALGKLKEVVEDVMEPVEFADCEDFNVDVREDEEIWTLEVDYWAASWVYLPGIKNVSKLVKDIFKKAGIKREG
ncbi:hypothetical protein G4O51_09425 [Candidatus Bathyarchaeota archaeon A05DMB-2]|jgi:hypothetical protein|nr:hypothetical protein [Candidatus Bathyarchaeota archaeon A05DMB-2]